MLVGWLVEESTECSGLSLCGCVDVCVHVLRALVLGLSIRFQQTRYHFLLICSNHCYATEMFVSVLFFTEGGSPFPSVNT